MVFWISYPFLLGSTALASSSRVRRAHLVGSHSSSPYDCNRVTQPVDFTNYRINQIWISKTYQGAFRGAPPPLWKTRASEARFYIRLGLLPPPPLFLETLILPPLEEISKYSTAYTALPTYAQFPGCVNRFDY